MIIYLDMDGVLTNFDKRMKEVTGDPKAMTNMSKEEIKILSSNTPNFFLDLEVLPDAKKMIKFLIGTGHEVKILTSAGAINTVSVVSQKRKWIKKNLSEFPDLLKNFNFVTSSKFKAQYADEDTILIDDRTVSIGPFRAAGGKGILHKSVSATISKVKSLL